MAEPGSVSGRARELAREYRAVVRGIAEKLGSPRIADALTGVDDPGALADTAGWSPDLSVERKVELLEELDPETRLEHALAWARESLAELELSEQIRNRVSEGMDKTQREFMLRQQLQAIREELGEGGDADDAVAELPPAPGRDRRCPTTVRVAVEREVDRLERMSEQSPEHGWIRTWLDTVLDVPWGKRSEERLDVADARAILDADHTGLDDVKDRIVEYLAVRKLRAERSIEPTDATQARRGAGAILALVGPPGVGKTSLGESVARALGTRVRARRARWRARRGGAARSPAHVRGRPAGADRPRAHRGRDDEPGHRARRGRQAGQRLARRSVVGAARGARPRAEPHVPRPLPRDRPRLSDVLFLATANVLETIPGPLLDRLEIIRLDGYTEDEKVVIARDHLLARQLERNGLVADDVAVTDDALRAVVTDYTREAGVRNLEREIGKLLRKTAARLVASEPTVGTARGDRRGRRRPRHWADRSSSPRSAERTTIARRGHWPRGHRRRAATCCSSRRQHHGRRPGSDADRSAGRRDEGVGADRAVYVQAHATELGVDPRDTRRRVHLHVPAGGIPKDGPSAGVTMTTALVSMLTGRPVRTGVWA